jgi:hypothetical protein
MALGRVLSNFLENFMDSGKMVFIMLNKYGRRQGFPAKKPCPAAGGREASGICRKVVMREKLLFAGQE